MERVLEVSGLTKMYKNGRGVQNITFHVEEGEIFGFLGPNGAGKTTVMKAVMGLNSFQSGEVTILGINIKTNFEKALEHVGAIIERADAYEYMSAYDNLKFVSRYYNHVGKEDIERVLAIVGLSEYRHEKVREFSLGMKQRVALAAALLSNPKLVILDEPTNGLDIEGTIEMRELIMKLAKEEKISFFISSHLAHEMELMCTRVAILTKGKLVNEGTLIEDIKAEFQSVEQFYMDVVKRKEGITA